MRLFSGAGGVLVLVIASFAFAPASGVCTERGTRELIGGLARSTAYDRTNVTIDVFVRDRDGNPVAGLERDQFRLLQDGVEVPITHFAAFEQAAADRAAPIPTAAISGDVEEVDRDAGVDRARPIYLILYLDNQYLRYADRNRVIRSLQYFVREGLAGPVQIMVVSHNRSLDIVQPFTGDRDAVLHALRRLRLAEAARDERDEERQGIQRDIRHTEKMLRTSTAGRDRTLSDLYSKIRTFAEEEEKLLEDALGAVREAGATLTGIDGRKSLVYVSNGLPLALAADLFHHFATLDARTMRGALTYAYQKKTHYDALAAAANAQGITIYTIDATGTSKPAAQVGDSDSPLKAATEVIARENRHTPLKLLARETGGLAVINTDDFAGGLERIGTALLTYYSIGYDIDSSGSDTIHLIEITVENEEKLETRYRRTFVEKSVHSQVQDDVTAALFFDVGDNPLDIEVVASPQVRATESRWLQPLSVSVPVTSLAITRDGGELVGRVMLFVAMRDSEGRTTDIQRQPHELRLTAGEYELRKDDRFTINLRLLLEPGRHNIVVGMLDEATHQTSIQRLRTTISSEE